MTVHVYTARHTSDDENPWDGNESLGVYTTLEGAQDAIHERFQANQDNFRWLPVGSVWTGVDPNAPAWKRVILSPGLTWEDGYYALDENGEWPDDNGFGVYVIQEVLRDGA